MGRTTAAQHAEARQNVREHGTTHRSTAEHTGARQNPKNTREHGKANRNAAEHTGARHTTQEH
eukprot:1413433-Pyramimonas_sp.AAC.1